MLTNVTKQQINWALREAISLRGLETMQMIGPARLIAASIEEFRDQGWHDYAAMIEQHRTEAEQYLAGLLGLA